MVEALEHSKLPEKELARIVRDRIQFLARRSGFRYLVDEPLKGMGMFGGVYNRSLYRNVEEDGIICIEYSDPRKRLLTSGFAGFVDISQLPVSSGVSYQFATDGKEKTIFHSPRKITDNSHQFVRYPLESRLEVPGDEKGRLARESLVGHTRTAAPIFLFLRDYWKDMLTDWIASRSPEKVEKSRVRLLDLKGRIDLIDPERDLIPPPVYV